MPIYTARLISWIKNKATLNEKLLQNSNIHNELQEMSGINLFDRCLYSDLSLSLKNHRLCQTSFSGIPVKLLKNWSTLTNEWNINDHQWNSKRKYRHTSILLYENKQMNAQENVYWLNLSPKSCTLRHYAYVICGLLIFRTNFNTDCISTTYFPSDPHLILLIDKCARGSLVYYHVAGFTLLITNR